MVCQTVHAMEKKYNHVRGIKSEALGDAIYTGRSGKAFLMQDLNGI